MPVYETVRRENGEVKLLLSPHEIYDLWLAALDAATEEYKVLDND